MNRYTPDQIEVLEPSEIFVFGSNNIGHHAGGAARQALEQFGAIQGQAEGIQGQSYAIPTIAFDGRPVTLDNIAASVETFMRFATDHPDLKFLVTKIGCGIAGWSEKAIGSVFQNRFIPPNVWLPESFVKDVDAAKSDENVEYSS